MTVQILLSTYDGTKYLRPLMESLLNQDYPRIEILIRDDGSNDATVNLLQEYASMYKNIRIIPGENLGFVLSFFRLLELSSPTVEYIALCDQDDIWKKEKVSRAVEFLSRYPKEVPVLYCSRIAVVDKSLQMLGYSSIPRRGLSFYNALVECPQGLGCTILLNQPARCLLHAFPRRVYSHDWWLYLVLSAFGTIIYDEEPSIFYRKHETNTLGITLGFLNKWKIKTLRFKGGSLQLVVDQAEEFMRMYGILLSKEQKIILERFVSYRRQDLHSRILYVLSCKLYHQSILEDLIFKLLIVLNLL